MRSNKASINKTNGNPVTPQGPVPLTSRALHVRLTRGYPVAKTNFKKNNANLSVPAVLKLNVKLCVQGPWVLYSLFQKERYKF